MWKRKHEPIEYGRVKQRRKGPSVKAVLACFFVTFFSLQICLVFVQHTTPEPKQSFPSPGHAAAASLTSSSRTQGMPQWIVNYIAWHNEMRVLYPGKLLFEHPDAPNVIVRVCMGLCGGLHDRLGQLPWDLYLANQTRRVLFIKWDRPQQLEHFLVPNAFNWTVPIDVKGFADIKETRSQKELFEGYRSDRPVQSFWDSELDISIERARYGAFKDVKVLRHFIRVHGTRVT